MEHVALHDIDSGSSARIASAFGFNCFEFVAAFRAGRVDVLESSPAFVESGIKPSRSGIPILFPYPNRIRNGRFLYEGREYRLPRELVGYAGEHAIHGFCLDRAWRILNRSAASVTGEFHFSVDDPARRHLWPGDFRLRVRYEVLGPALRCDIQIDNPGNTPLPFGLGTHPYLKLPLSGNSRFEDCLVQVPAASYCELVDYLPTGRKLPVQGRFDLREGERLGGLKFDDVYTDVTYESHALVSRVVDPSAGLEVVQSCDRTFRELVVLTPHWSQSVCIEPYTCLSDAMNLDAEGFDAGLRILSPGDEFRTWFELRVGPVTA